MLADTLFSSDHIIIPFILEEEDKQLHTEIASTTALSVVFDGSTHLGEAVAVIVCFVDTSWILQQRLVRLHAVSSSLNGQELTRELTQCLPVKFQIPSSRLVAAIRDGAAVHGVALRNMKEIMFPQLFDIICSSHSLHNAGRHFDTPLLDEFG